MKGKTFPKLMIIISLVAALAVVVPVLSGCLPGKAPAPAAPAPEAPAPAAPAPEAPAPEEAPPKTVNVGAIFAVTGPAAGWSEPGIYGMEIVIDDINAAGGLRVGDERYLVNLIVYDDEHTSSKALLGAKKLVLENDVKYVGSLSSPPVNAIAPFLMENKVILSPLESANVHPDRPYLIAGYDYYPRGDVLRTVYIKQTYPEVETVAVLVQEDVLGVTGLRWQRAGWESMGVDIVYEKLYAMETIDFAPVISATLAADPDVVDLAVSYPEFATLLIEQLYFQGFEGIITHNAIDLEAVLARVPAEWLAGLVDSYPEFNDPWWGDPSPQLDFYQKWTAKYGPGAPEDVFRRQGPIDWLYGSGLQVWLKGVELAGTLDADEVLTALRAQESLDILQGPIYWPEAALDIWGIQNLYEPLQVACEITPDGLRRIQKEMDLWNDWYPENKDILLRHLEEAGVLWWQIEY